ncbi:Glutathione-binding protein GsiB precursor [Roseivivax jejudonensis]|uniref:Glutathione-binding protein GsiB n=1 Tax=Roseivivax jejudonensis TaxID=1529041 RepID=A0A1X6ZYH6_9RHOB|nr:ABC transporter substrate-binding protein [Roseivivax jejudonensis]SLN64929.1 Glutathione-binding protein GsiB precursor [Roseivivax jejudonensis]
MRLTLCAAAALLALPASAEEFRWASTTDPQTMDPHAVSSTPVLGFLNNVYEGLVRRGKDMSIEPALATAWEPIDDGAGWRFTLREDVTFHDGADFTAEDVVFSYERASSEQSDVSSWFAPVSEVVAVDDYTVDIMTTSPQPLFPDSIANWMMMDSGWAAENGAERPARDEENAATLQANGTAAFRLEERQPGLSTVLVPFEGWWGEPEHNVTRAEFTPIQNSATAVAALLSGEVDMINPVPVQDAARLDEADGVEVIRGIEARVIMLGFAHDHDTLTGGADQGADNPFSDPLVRRAVAHAVNVPAILQTIMRGSAEPASQLVGHGMSGYSEANSERPEYDPERARELLAEAGYPDGFGFGFSCTNDRYLNDESVCQAVVSMLAQVGLEAQLNAMPVQNYWPELRAGNFDMYLLGWSPGTFDAEHPLRFLVHTAGERLGTWNFGGYSNDRIDELLPQIQSELDPEARQAMLDETARIIQEDAVYVPLYIQPLLWGVQENVSLTQRPDDFFILRWVTVE